MAMEATRAHILASAWQLLAKRGFADLRLDDVAAGADTTVRTLLRAFGSKEMLFAATLDSLGELGQGPVTPGDVVKTASTMFDFYDKVGDMVIRWLADENRVPAMRPYLAAGRAHLRAWVTGSFAPELAGKRGRARKELLSALIVPLDVYTWKLLRRDFGLSRRDAERVVVRTIRSLIQGG